MDDTELLRQYLETGSETAFANLVNRHFDLVYSAALRRTDGDPHRATEVAQMVFTDLARKAAQLKNHPLLAGWLHRSTRWAAANLRRAEQRRIAKEQAAAVQHEILGSSEPIADWRMISPLLDNALDDLSQSDRDAVLLRYFQDRPFSEIGEKLGLSENAARMRVDRALGKLHSRLTRHGITSTSAALGLAMTQNAVTAAPAGLAGSTAGSAVTSVTTTGLAEVVGNLLMTKIQIGLAGAFCFVLAVGLALQLGENRRLQTQLVALRQQDSAAQTARTAVDKHVNEQQETLHHLAAVLAEQTPVLTPEQQERVRLDTLIRKGELDNDYAPLFRRLKLPPELLDKFKELLVERNQAIYDAVKLAKSQGIEPSSYTEQRQIGEAAATEIDGRIATLLGEERNRLFHEIVDNQPYVAMAEVLAAMSLDALDYRSSMTPEFDRKIDAIMAVLVANASEYLDETYRANGWPVPMPAKLHDALAKVMPPEEIARIDDQNALQKVHLRMYEIARKAALDGKLPLSKSSSRDYPARDTSPATTTR